MAEAVFFQRTGLFLGARRQIQIAAGDLAGCRRNGIGALAYFTDNPQQVVVHDLECAQQLSGFIFTAGLNIRGQIAIGYPLCHFDCGTERPGNDPRDPHRQRNRQGDTDAHQDEDTESGLAVNRIGTLVGAIRAAVVDDRQPFLVAPAPDDIPRRICHATARALRRHWMRTKRR